MQKLLTIVVPVYKVEAYINKCLDSLLISPDLMEKLEVIIVNDGTPDDSAEMSREYVKRFPETFRQIDKENGGHGSAWNVGLKEASGKYLRFLDSDDWFTSLDCLMEDLEGTDVDLVFNPFIREYTYEERTEIIDVPQPMGNGLIDPSNWGVSRWGFHNVNFWAITYKVSLLKPLLPLFAEKTMFDDYILTWAVLVHGRTGLSLDYPVYHYLIGRPGQSMSLTQQRKGAIAYVNCFAQYELVRSRIDPSEIPSEFLSGIDRTISEYAKFIFPFMAYLPFWNACERMKYLWRNYVSAFPDRSKLMKRYSMMPGAVFYFVERLRLYINQARG